jgi:hypothetical protein
MESRADHWRRKMKRLKGPSAIVRRRMRGLQRELAALPPAPAWHPTIEQNDVEQEAEFEAGYKFLRNFRTGRRTDPTGYPRPRLDELAEALPYRIEEPLEAIAFTRILYALYDRHTPKDVKAALKHWVHDLIITDGHLRDARPVRVGRPPAIPSSIHEAFKGPRGRSLRQELKNVCRRGDADSVLTILRGHLELGEQQMARVREAVMEPKGRALAVVQALDAAISEASARRLLYGG